MKIKGCQNYLTSSHFHALVRAKVTKVFVSCYINVQWIRSHPVYFDSLLSCSDFFNYLSPEQADYRNLRMKFIQHKYIQHADIGHACVSLLL